MKEQDKFLAQCRAVFDRGVQDLDAATLSRLTRARQRALSRLDRPARRYRRGWLPAAAATLIAILAAVLLWSRPQPPAPPVAANVEDMEILLADEELELYSELEFYAWLEENPHAG